MMKLPIVVFLLKTFILPETVLGQCSSVSSLSSSDISLILKTSPIVVKAKVRKIRGDQSALIKILEVYKGKFDFIYSMECKNKAICFQS